jgi:hypothetical protein
LNVFIGAFISNGGEASVGANIANQTFRIQAWESADYKPPDLTQGKLVVFVLLSGVYSCFVWAF